MKSFSVVAVAVACLAASTSPLASAEKCVLTNLVKELEPITKMVYACHTATGYAVIPPRANPTPEQTAAVCAKCPEMIATAKTMTFATCTFAVSGVDIPLNEWVPKITGACDAASTNTSGASTNGTAASPVAGSTSNSSTSTTNSTTVGSTTNSSSSTAANDSSSAAAATPTPTPKSGAASAAASVGVAAVAIGSLAASILF